MLAELLKMKEKDIEFQSGSSHHLCGLPGAVFLENISEIFACAATNCACCRAQDAVQALAADGEGLGGHERHESEGDVRLHRQVEALRAGWLWRCGAGSLGVDQLPSKHSEVGSFRARPQGVRIRSGVGGPAATRDAVPAPA